MIATCLAILAVDFPIFPRRFAKVENWGTSIMDMGVGAFVFSAGVVSARSMLRLRIKGNGASQRPAFARRLLLSIRHSIPLLILGLIRLYSVKGLDYAEHVTEYGVHWNFFFTLGLVPPFVELSDLLTTHVIRSYDLLAIIFAVVYQIILESTSLKPYILVSPRGPSLLSKNREGIFSFVGYLAIFLAGRGTGMIVNAPPERPSSKKNSNPIVLEEHARNDRKTLIRNLALRSTIYTILFLLTTHYQIGNVTVSRRLANLPYVLWVVAFNNAQILLFCLAETVAFPPAAYQAQPTSTTSGVSDGVSSTSTSSRIMQAYNKNGLLIFLAANLLTGGVNLTTNTLDMGPGPSMAILLAYALTVTGIALGLDFAGVRVRF